MIKFLDSSLWYIFFVKDLYWLLVKSTQVYHGIIKSNNACREILKYYSEVRLECILVSTSAVKIAIDDMLQRLFDTLIWTLRYSINNEIHVTFDLSHLLLYCTKRILEAMQMFRSAYKYYV